MYGSTLSLTSTPVVGVWLAQRPSYFTPGKTRYPLYRRLGGPQGRSGRVRIDSTGIRSPDRPDRSESLYRLSSPGPRRPNCIFYCMQRHIAHLRLVSQFRIWHYIVTGTERNVCRCAFNRCSVVTRFAKLAAGAQLCRPCTHAKL